MKSTRLDVGYIFMLSCFIFLPFIFSGCALFDSFFSSGDEAKKTNIAMRYKREYPNRVYSRYPDRLEVEDMVYLSKMAFVDLQESRFYSSIIGEAVIAFSDFSVSNNRMKEDVEQITAKLIEFFRSTKKLLVTRSIGGRGAYTERLLKSVRSARDNEEYKQDSVVEKEGQLSAHYALRGNLNIKNLRENKEYKALYLFALEIIDLSSGVVVWNKTVEITKIKIH